MLCFRSLMPRLRFMLFIQIINIIKAYGRLLNCLRLTYVFNIYSWAIITVVDESTTRMRSKLKNRYLVFISIICSNQLILNKLIYKLYTYHKGLFGIHVTQAHFQVIGKLFTR